MLATPFGLFGVDVSMGRSRVRDRKLGKTNPGCSTPVAARHDVVRRPPQVCFLTTPPPNKKIRNKSLSNTAPSQRMEKQTLPHVCCQQTNISSNFYVLRAVGHFVFQQVRSCKTFEITGLYTGRHNLWQWLADKQIQKYLQVVPVKRQQHVCLCLQFVQLLSQCQETFVASPVSFSPPKKKRRKTKTPTQTANWVKLFLAFYVHSI